MQNKMTPGPWEAVSFNLEPRYVIGSDNVLVADTYADSPLEVGLPSLPESQANAKAIAAVPELISALKIASLELLDMADIAGDDPHFNEGGSAYEAIQIIEAALIKAGAQ